MANSSKIEWCDSTWNVITGCTLVSEGCRNCYAAQLAATRLKHHTSREGLAVLNADGVAKFNGKVRFNDQWLDQPLRWRKPRMVFVCAHGDLFHEAVPDAWIDRVFAIMALCPHHTFQVLTKRPDRMRAYLNDETRPPRIQVEGFPAYREAFFSGEHQFGSIYFNEDEMTWHMQWPLPNVWLGVSVEDQAAADARIPDLLATPAAVRFISAEPLLGPVNLSRWIPPISPVPEDSLPDTWADFDWPEWVPDDLRKQVERFWAEDFGRSPKAWVQNMHSNSAPPTGVRSDVCLFANRGQTTNGRFLFCWNNIGRVELEDGSWRGCSFDRHLPSLNWVIVGGESGKNARPMHPDWARDLRDQCAAADVAFFFKQWGKWLPECQDPNGIWDWADADERGILHFWQDGPGGLTASMPLSKNAAGRLLDGAEHSAMPVHAVVPKAQSGGNA